MFAFYKLAYISLFFSNREKINIRMCLFTRSCSKVGKPDGIYGLLLESRNAGGA